MKRNSYYPARVGDQITWLNNFANKLPGQAATLGLAAATVTAIVADCLWLAYILQAWQPAVRAWSLAATNAVNLAQTGDGTALMELPVFTPPALPGTVTATNTGALNRIFNLVQQIKDNKNCTDAIALDLGIIGSAHPAPDYTTLQPIIDAVIVGNQVNVKWGWNGYSAYLDMCELQVDRGDGKGFVPLAFDTTPGYTDTQTFPAAPAKWTYRAIYRVGDGQVGLWSAPVSVVVG